MSPELITITEKVIKGTQIDKSEAYFLATLTGPDIYKLFSYANNVRDSFRGDFIDLCSIINSKSGACPEDCSYCSQSAHYNTKVNIYPLISKDKIIEKAKSAKKNGARRFCIVTSGRSIENTEEIKAIAEYIKEIKGLSLLPCATLGMLGEKELCLLKEAGLNRYHHNLETSEAFFPEICTTHTYREKVMTIKKAKELGLSICSGGIFGMGEGWKERIEMAFALRDLGVDSVPINFLNPIPGTPLEGKGFLNPIEALKIIAIYRFILPDKEIRICGGRNVALRTLQPLIFTSGADALLIGDYLTTTGRNTCDDLRMMEDLGLRW
jgi:biotin synthase